jgi:hypothetical protein
MRNADHSQFRKKPFTIGRLAKASSVGIKTIRYYQRRGLLPVSVGASRQGLPVGWWPTQRSETAALPMPNKLDAAGRHHIPKIRHRMTNGAEYKAGLRRRGSLTMWVR